MSKLRIKVHSEVETLPVLVTFSGNTPSQVISNGTADEENLEEIRSQHFVLYNKRKQQTLYFRNKTFEYSGKRAQGPMNFAIGIASRKKKTLDLIPVHGLFSLHPHNRKERKRDKPTGVSKGDLYQNLDHMDKKQLLVKEFGTKKSKKKMKIMRSNVVDEENIFQSH